MATSPYTPGPTKPEQNPTTGNQRVWVDVAHLWKLRLTTGQVCCALTPFREVFCVGCSCRRLTSQSGYQKTYRGHKERFIGRARSGSQEAQTSGQARDQAGAEGNCKDDKYRSKEDHCGEDDGYLSLI